MLAIANRALSSLSLKLVPKSRPTREFKAFFQHLKSKGIEFQTIIDVGVAFGTPALYESFPNSKFYLIEPVPDCKPILDDLTRVLDAEAFNVAAGSEDGMMDFHVHTDISGSSPYRQWEGELLDGKKISVPVRRLDSLVTMPVVRPCLLKIDTQGAELDVLAGATKTLNEVDMVIVEASFHQFRRGAPEFSAVVSKFSELGFECYEVLEGHYRAVDNALAQVDLAFIRPDSLLRSEKGFFSREQVRLYLSRAVNSVRIS